MVVGNLAGDVVENVSLGDTVGGSSTNPTHDAAEIAKKVTVEGSQSAAREGELGCTVVGENGVGVLEERDHDEPVVHPTTRSVLNRQCQCTSDVPKVRNEVEAEDISKAEVVNRHANSQSPDDNATIGEDDLSVVVRREDDRVGVEVCESTVNKES